MPSQTCAAGIVQALLGSPNDNAAKGVPEEIKYVMIALSKDGAGPLSDLIVTSGMFLTESGSSATPARLSLLPRNSVWANNAITGLKSVNGKAPGRLLEASKSTRYLDIASAAKNNCGAFISLGAPLPDSSVAVIVVLGFEKRGACSPAALQMAQSILTVATTRCTDSIHSVFAVTEMLMSPPPFPRVQDPATDDEGDAAAADDDWHQEEQFLTSVIPPSNAVTLAFDDTDLEAEFGVWYNRSLSRLDGFGYVLCAFAAVLIMFAPNTAFSQVSGMEGLQAWRSLPSLFPGALLLLPRTRRFYSRHREVLLLFTFAMVTQWELHVRHYMDCINPAVFVRPFYLHGYGWLAVMILMYQMRSTVLAPLALACFAADMTLLPAVCANFYPGMALGACMGWDSGRLAVLVVAAPLMLARLMERRARQLFLARAP